MEPLKITSLRSTLDELRLTREEAKAQLAASELREKNAVAEIAESLKASHAEVSRRGWNLTIDYVYGQNEQKGELKAWTGSFEKAASMIQNNTGHMLRFSMYRHVGGNGDLRIMTIRMEIAGISSFIRWQELDYPVTLQEEQNAINAQP